MPRIKVDLSGKVAFVTGGGSGIGRGLSLQLAHCGAAVAVTDLDGEAAAAVAEEIEQAGGRALARPLDVTSPQAVQNTVSQIIGYFGQIDYTCANAGTLGPAEYAAVTPDDWNHVLDVNINGVVYTCEAVVPHLKERRQGRILITASYNGVRAGTHVIPYRVSKAAILMYTRCLALLLAPYNVTVNALCPGVTLTPMQLTYAAQTAVEQGVTLDEYVAGRASRIPMQRLTEIEDVSELAMFLLSDSARLITGQAIAPDGGVLMSS